MNLTESEYIQLNEWPTQMLSALFFTILPIETILGLMANFICYQIFNEIEYKTTMFKLSAASSIIDIFVLIFALVYGISEKLIQPNQIKEKIFLDIVLYILRSLYVMSSLSCLAVTLHRFLYLIKHKRSYNLPYKLTLFLIVIFGFFLEFPLFFMNFANNYFVLHKNLLVKFQERFLSNYQRNMNIAIFFVHFTKITCALTMLFMTVYLLVKLVYYSKHRESSIRSLEFSKKESSRSLTSNHHSTYGSQIKKNRKLQRNLTKMVVYTSIVFVVDQVMLSMVLHMNLFKSKTFAYFCFALLTIFLHSTNLILFYKFDRYFASRLKSYFSVLKSIRLRKSCSSSF